MDDKKFLIEKYKLKHENHAWYSERENSHKHLIFKDSFFERSDVLGLLFRINKLCMAKVKYFRTNINKYEPLKYDYQKGFISVPLWDADFLKHRASGYILDFRYLQTITVYDDFAALCDKLESFEYNQELLDHIDKIHTTEMSVDRIRKNLKLDQEDVVEYCRNKISDKNCHIYQQGKNWYCEIGSIRITINAHSYTIITAHLMKEVIS